MELNVAERVDSGPPLLLVAVLVSLTDGTSGASAEKQKLTAPVMSSGSRAHTLKKMAMSSSASSATYMSARRASVVQKAGLERRFPNRELIFSVTCEATIRVQKALADTPGVSMRSKATLVRRA